MKKVVIIGAGPAGLTAGYDLLSRTREYDVTIVDENDRVGGICRRYESNGKVLDAGGHYFISNNSQVKNFWNAILPAQGTPSRDDIFLERYCKISNGGPNPEQEDNVLLSREKYTRVLKDGKFFESPFYLNTDTMKTIGVGTSIKTSFSRVGSSLFNRKDKSLEGYYESRFGRQLYNMFLEDYIDKVWGKRPIYVSSKWGPISEKDLIVPVIQTDKNADKDLEKAAPPYAPRFSYPKYGVAQMWERTADKFMELGGSIHKNCKVVSIRTEDNVITGIDCLADGDQFFVPCDILISSMPIRALVQGMNDVPYNVREVVHALGYRDLVSVGVELSDMCIKNNSAEKTIKDILPDSSIYVQDSMVKLGRIQILNNFSPYMVGNPDHVWLGLNYYCNEGDYYWNLSDSSWRDLVINDLMNLGLIKDPSYVLDFMKVAVKKAFPGYFDSFDRLDEVVEFLNGFGNLYCVGRNGQHRFSTMDTAMLTSFEAVKNIISGKKSKENIWEVSDSSADTDSKAYNSGLLSDNVVYTGNAVPIQRTDNIPDVDDKPRNVEIRRMRRPMMTPIKKAEPPKEEEENREPIVLNNSVVIAARPEKTIPIEVDEPQNTGNNVTFVSSDMTEITSENIIENRNDYSAEPTYESENSFVSQTVNTVVDSVPEKEIVEDYSSSNTQNVSLTPTIVQTAGQFSSYYEEKPVIKQPEANSMTSSFSTISSFTENDDSSYERVLQRPDNSQASSVSFSISGSFAESTAESEVRIAKPVYKETYGEGAFNSTVSLSRAKSFEANTAETENRIARPVNDFSTPFTGLSPAFPTSSKLSSDYIAPIKPQEPVTSNVEDIFVPNPETDPIPKPIVSAYDDNNESIVRDIEEEAGKVSENVIQKTPEKGSLYDIPSSPEKSVYHMTQKSGTEETIKTDVRAGAVEKEHFSSLWDEVAKSIPASDARYNEEIKPVKTYQDELAQFTATLNNSSSAFSLDAGDSETSSGLKSNLTPKKPGYISRDIDTSIVFKNARVIKSTKITAEDKNIDSSMPKRTPFISENEKVIAVIRNGEKIPVGDGGKSSKTRKPRTSKKDEPISVIIDAENEANEASLPETPKKRVRRTKASKENND